MTRLAVCQLGGRPLDDAAGNLAACRALVVEAGRAGAEIAVLPEGAYPAYVLGSAEAARAVLAAGPDPIEAFGAMARAARLTLVAGLVRDEDGRLFNSAVAFSPQGTVIGSVAKRFLWHFDAVWFAAGPSPEETRLSRDSPVWSTPVGPVGALVCADARLPEISRILALRGAALVCDPTAWVTSRALAPTNIQPEFLIAARALENGVAVAAASKCGFEGDTVAYVGRSVIVGPDGVVVAEAGVHDEGVVVADLDLRGLPRPPVARRPELYGRLAEPDPRSPPMATATRVRVAAANRAEAAAALRLSGLAAQGVGLVAVPNDAGDVAALARESGLWVAGADASDGVVASPAAGIVARFPQAHGAGATAKSLAPPVSTPVGRLAVLVGPDVLVPEQARVATLDGAEVLVASGAAGSLALLRARAAENRVFVVASGAEAGTVVVAPSGAILADAPVDRAFVCSADLFLAEAADKTMAPGTDVLAGRCPLDYRELVSDS